MLVTRLAKARFGQVGDQVNQVKDQVGQGQGQELDNFSKFYFDMGTKLSLQILKKKMIKKAT